MTPTLKNIPSGRESAKQPEKQNPTPSLNHASTVRTVIGRLFGQAGGQNENARTKPEASRHSEYDGEAMTTEKYRRTFAPINAPTVPGSTMYEDMVLHIQHDPELKQILDDVISRRRVAASAKKTWLNRAGGYLKRGVIDLAMSLKNGVDVDSWTESLALLRETFPAGVIGLSREEIVRRLKSK